MKRSGLAFLLVTLLGLPITSCESSPSSVILPDLAIGQDLLTMPLMDMTSSGPDLTTPPNPARPLVGMQIDRMGRPAINNALTDFSGQNQNSNEDQVKNQYNASIFTNWGAFAPAPYLATNLAVFDGLDGVCGNQFRAGAAGATRYQTLATLLADDRLFVNGLLGTCTTYLAAEQAVANDCGGRTPSMKVMDATYNLLITGDPAGTYTNGVLADADGAPSATFPFLLPPT